MMLKMVSIWRMAGNSKNYLVPKYQRYHLGIKCFPRCPSSAVPLVSAPSTDIHRGVTIVDGATRTIFVVDDDHGTRMALSHLLEAAGYQVRSFESAENF